MWNFALQGAKRFVAVSQEVVLVAVATELSQLQAPTADHQTTNRLALLGVRSSRLEILLTRDNPHFARVAPLHNDPCARQITLHLVGAGNLIWLLHADCAARVSLRGALLLELGIGSYQG